MNDVFSPRVFEEALVEQELLECLRKIGKGLIASGVSVGVVENTLTEIALTYNMDLEIMALPNFLMIKLGRSSEARVDLAVQRLTSLQLDTISEFGVLVDRVKRKDIALGDAVREIDRILAKKHRFGPVLIVLGYVLSCIGLTMLFRPELRAMIITGSWHTGWTYDALVSETAPLQPVAPNICGDRRVDFDFSAHSNGGNIWIRKSAHHTSDHVFARSPFNHRDD